MADTATIEQYWTKKQVADRFQVSEEAVKKWLRLGKLRRIKIGAATRIAESDIQTFIAVSTERASSAA